MDLFEMIKKHAKLYMILSIVVLLGTIGVTYSLVISRFREIGINTTTAEIDADITYETNGNGAEIINNGNMLPINDESVTGPDITDTRVLKVKFNVSGLSSNPENTIYDIVLRDIDIDCDLRTKDLKWRLYKNSTKLSEGNLSPEFDTMANNRLVLTNTQEDLTTNVDKYTFLLWISESCTGDIANCDSSMAQNKYLNKTLKATIKVELATNSKKTLERITASEESCTYTPIEVPLCNELTYTGSAQTLINSGTNYTLINSKGTNAGEYVVTAKLKDGYKWSNGSTADKAINCSIDEKYISITTLDQTIVYGNKISSAVNKVSTDGLLSGNTLNTITLNSSIVDVGTGIISTNNVKIVDSKGNDVTNNYKVDKRNTGKVTITCLNASKEPTVYDKIYNGEVQVGAVGGEYITITGNNKATGVGNYQIIVSPYKNYCWSDETTTPKEYTWRILDNDFVKDAFIVTLDNNGAKTTGTTILYSAMYSGTSIGLYLDSNYTKKLTDNENPITIPTRTGYTFNGYYSWDSDSAETGFVIDKNGYLYVFSPDLIIDEPTLYADWIPNSYTVVYNANGGSGTMANSTHYSGTSKALSTNTFKRDGYTFKGWATSPTGSVAYSDGKKVNYYSPTDGKIINLYAVWEDDIAPSVPAYTAVYADGSGTFTSGNYANQEVRTTITSTDKGSGVSHMEYSSDKNSWTRLAFAASNGISNSNGTYSGIESWRPEDNRIGTYYFRACDTKGNCSNASEAYSIKFDTTLPTMGDVEVASNIFGAISAYNMARSEDPITTYSSDTFLTLGEINITNVTKVIITHSSPVTVADTYKVYYATSGEEFDEENFVEQAVSVGDTVVKIDMPGGDYTALKFVSDSGNGGEVIDIVGDGVSTDNYIHTKVGDTTSGISAYAITNSNVEPTSWIDITNSSSYDIRAEISNNTSTYIWVKDAAGNITSKNLKLAVANYYYYDKVYTQTSTTANCIIDSDSSTCNFKIPSFVTSSTGPDNATYYGVSTSPSSSTVTTTYNSTNLNYYAVYKGSWTATYEKGSDVTAIGSTSNSCTNFKRTNGTTYSSTSCTITLPTITSESATVIGWYDSSDKKVGYVGDSLTLSANGTFTAKAKELSSSEFTYDNSNTGVDCSDVSCMIDELYELTLDISLGDYVYYKSEKALLWINEYMTGYSGVKGQTLDPAELELWRVLNINKDGTVDLISEYVSSTEVCFEGLTGYQNLVGYLNELAKEYETEGITVGSRHFGYNGQTEYITDTSKFTTTAPWTCSTGEDCNPVESQGGGDELYEKDYDQVYTALGTRVAYKVGTETETPYWMASRYYEYDFLGGTYWWRGRIIESFFGENSDASLYYNDTSNFGGYSWSNSLRPIITLAADINYGDGSGTKDSPWKIKNVAFN